MHCHRAGELKVNWRPSMSPRCSNIATPAALVRTADVAS
jgi:hypothetical protein